MNELELLFGSMFTIVTFETVLVLLFLLKTPAWAFLKAAWSKRMIIIHPKSNHFLDFYAAKLSSNLAYIKNYGYYLVDPKCNFIESKSKVPCTIVYGTCAHPIHPKTAKIAERLSAIGIKYYDDLLKLINEMKQKGQMLQINILGENVDLIEAVNHFNTSDKSDIIEAEIQRRTASQIMARLGAGRDILKYAVAVLIILIGVAIAYAIFSQFLGGPSPSQIMQQATRVIAPVPENITTAVR